MRILRKAKANLFPLLIAMTYAAMFVFRPSMGIESVQNSAYYIKEMLMIMPAIFVLTALLDAWVPKSWIMRIMGKEAGVKGALFSLVLGSISAGPIYAAFPLCVMLHQKGASLRNLVIILSAWAVIKVPMLLNEMKFLGVRFMVSRWVLTVVAIFIFSWITSKLVRNSELQGNKTHTENLVTVNRAACMGCGVCKQKYPAMFTVEGGKAVVKNNRDQPDEIALQEAMQHCPVRAISINKPS